MKKMSFFSSFLKKIKFLNVTVRTMVGLRSIASCALALAYRSFVSKKKKEKEKRIGVAYTSHGLGVSHGTCLCLIHILGSVTNTKYYIVVVFKAASHGIPSPKSHSCYQVPTWRQNLTFRASRQHQNMVCIHISWIKKKLCKRSHDTCVKSWV
jgi:hypothetical protein